MKSFLIPLVMLAASIGLSGTLYAQQDQGQVYVCFYAAPLEKTINIQYDIYQGIARSSDEGVTWQNIGHKTSFYNDLSIEPGTGHLFAASEYGVLRSTNGGENWKQLNSWDIQTVFKVIFLNGNIWLATPQGPAVSKDDGVTWAFLTKGLKPVNATYVSDMITDGNDIIISTADGIYLSTNGGALWNPAGLQGKEIDGLARHQNTKSVMAAYQHGAGIWISTDNGRSWQEANGDLHSRKVQTVAFDPRDPSVMYSGMSDYPVCKTTDGGKTWKTINNGLMINNITAVEPDPANPERVYAGTENGLWLSTDGGGKWDRTDIRFGFVSAIRFKGGQK